tara:strand:- start:72 stop:461 length:390 start_codon:yes stop_codon:yes gene_type:complete
MKKVKPKAIHARLRHESNTFNGYLKYEVTIENPDGSTEIVPAYGKDLQDALSRVVHDEKVMKVKPIVDKIPQGVWVILWFIGIGAYTGIIFESQAILKDWIGVIYITGIVGLTVTILSVRNWFKLRNRG